MHICPDELSALATVGTHVSCLLCWLRVWFAQLSCHLRGHHKGVGK